MKLSPRLSLALAFAVAVGARTRPQEAAQREYQADLTSHAPAHSPMPVASDPSALGIHPRVSYYATESEGDHSLEAATVVEQAFAQYTLYTVRLQFASGAEQSVVLTAPPGGLQPEMRDMSGDSVPNDLVLTSGLLGLPLIVLLNEGHDHLTVAISPGSFAAREGQASGPHQTQRAFALVSSRPKSSVLKGYGSQHRRQLADKLPLPVAPFSEGHAEHPSAAGRAPPALVTPLLHAAQQDGASIFV